MTLKLESNQTIKVHTYLALEECVISTKQDIVLTPKEALILANQLLNFATKTIQK